MTFSKEEYVGMAVSIIAVVLLFAGLHLIQGGIFEEEQVFTGTHNSVVIEGSADPRETLWNVLDARGEVTSLVIEDLKEGEGSEVSEGDLVTVHYIGVLKNGTVFDDSYARGESFSFTVGAGDVIEGWEKGFVGMQVGGQRILIVPPSMGYGSYAVGAIPAGSTLIFAVELLAVE